MVCLGAMQNKKQKTNKPGKKIVFQIQERKYIIQAK